MFLCGLVIVIMFVLSAERIIFIFNFLIDPYGLGETVRGERGRWFGKSLLVVNELDWGLGKEGVMGDGGMVDMIQVVRYFGI